MRMPAAFARRAMASTLGRSLEPAGGAGHRGRRTQLAPWAARICSGSAVRPRSVYVAPAAASWTANERSCPTTVDRGARPRARSSATHVPGPARRRTVRANSEWWAGSHAGVPTGMVAATRWPPASIVTRAAAPPPARLTPKPSSRRGRPRSTVTGSEPQAVVAALRSLTAGALALAVRARSTSGPSSRAAAGAVAAAKQARTARTRRRGDMAPGIPARAGIRAWRSARAGVQPLAHRRVMREVPARAQLVAQLAQEPEALGDDVVLVDGLEVLLARGDERVVAQAVEALDRAADGLAHAVLDEARAAVGLLHDGGLVGALHELVDLARHRVLDDGEKLRGVHVGLAGLGQPEVQRAEAALVVRGHRDGLEDALDLVVAEPVGVQALA